MTGPRIVPLGDSAITLVLGEGISEALSRRVVATAERIRTAGISGVRDVVASYSSVAVHFDPLSIAHSDLRSRVTGLLNELDAVDVDPDSARFHRIGVRYDGEDLEEVAGRLGLTIEDVKTIHASVEYRVFVIGFVPGFAYMGPLDERLALPRRDSPRKRVPPGSVAIAERQTAVYPSATPGGWHLIGTTSEPLFDPHRDEPAMLRVGDRVKFEAR